MEIPWSFFFFLAMSICLNGTFLLFWFFSCFRVLWKDTFSFPTVPGSQLPIYGSREHQHIAPPPHASTYLALFNHFFHFEVYNIYLANSLSLLNYNPSEFFSISIGNFRAYLTYFSSIQTSVSLVFNISSWIEDSSITTYMLSLLISNDFNSPLQSTKSSLLVPITNHLKLFLI